MKGPEWFKVFESIKVINYYANTVIHKYLQFGVLLSVSPYHFHILLKTVF